VTSTIVSAPLTRRNGRELLYCRFGGLAGVAAFWVTVVLLLAGLTISASAMGTVIRAAQFHEFVGQLQDWGTPAARR
jgi:hypothetical protein